MNEQRYCELRERFHPVVVQEAMNELMRRYKNLWWQWSDERKLELLERYLERQQQGLGWWW